MKTLLALCALSSGLGMVHAAPVLSESFDDVAALAADGWIMQNLSSPRGPSDWFQGNTVVFEAASGAPDAYIAANYRNTLEGGLVSNWLMTPVLQLADGAVLSFAFRGPLERPYFDLLEIYVSVQGASTDVDAFRLLGAVTTQQQTSSSWQTRELALPYLGDFSGRLAFRYTGTDDHVNYIGLDDVVVTSPAQVPEPATGALLACGLLGLLASRRFTARGARSSGS